MTRRRGRPRRPSRVRVWTERRDTIDYAGLARAVLEQAAMDDQAGRAQAEHDRTGRDGAGDPTRGDSGQEATDAPLA